MADRAAPGVDVVGVLLAAQGAILIGLSVIMLVEPGTFFEAIGPFGERNDHYTRDAATFQLALGVLAIVAARRPILRMVTIAVLALQFLLHLVNHLVDLDEAVPRSVGVVDAVALALGLVLLAWMALLERKAHR